MTISKLCIMQSRLSLPRGRGLQFFPFEEWRDEFPRAASLGISGIEFVFPFKDFDKTPLWTKSGTREIKKIVAETGVLVPAISADYFVESPFFIESAEGENSERVLIELIRNAASANILFVEIPILDQAIPSSRAEMSRCISVLEKAAMHAEKLNVGISIEMEKSAYEVLDVVKTVRGKLGIVYDTGNSASLGLPLGMEILALRDYLTNVHIKDRLANGRTVALGCGTADFAEAGKALAAIQYTGWTTLQAARSTEGNEIDDVREQIEFLRKL